MIRPHGCLVLIREIISDPIRVAPGVVERVEGIDVDFQAALAANKRITGIVNVGC